MGDDQFRSQKKDCGNTRVKTLVAHDACAHEKAEFPECALTQRPLWVPEFDTETLVKIWVVKSQTDAVRASAQRREEKKKKQLEFQI